MKRKIVSLLREKGDWAREHQQNNPPQQLCYTRTLSVNPSIPSVVISINRILIEWLLLSSISHMLSACPRRYVWYADSLKGTQVSKSLSLSSSPQYPVE